MRSFAANALKSMKSPVCSENRMLLITGGRLCATLAQILLCFNGKCAVRNALRLWTSALSRRHLFRNSSATCVATLKGHSGPVTSVAFHPTAPLLATGSRDKTVRLWKLPSDNSCATCVSILAGHPRALTDLTAPVFSAASRGCRSHLPPPSSSSAPFTLLSPAVPAALQGTSGPRLATASTTTTLPQLSPLPSTLEPSPI